MIKENAKQMNKEKFLEKLQEILDIEESPSMETVLKEMEEWDSLSIVSFSAMADVECNKKIEANKIRSAKTIQDLYELLA